MSPNARFADNDRAFSELVSAVQVQLDIDQRLPGWPFLQPTGFAVIYEFGRVLGGSFGIVLESLATSYRDDVLTVVGLDPPASYYGDAYHVLPGFQMSGDRLARSYASAMLHRPDDDPTGSLRISLNVVGMAGSSGTWAAWAQRDWEIGILLTADAAGPWLSVDVPWFGRDVDLDSIRGPDGWVVPLSDADRSTFWGNLRERGSGP